MSAFSNTGIAQPSKIGTLLLGLMCTACASRAPLSQTPAIGYAADGAVNAEIVDTGKDTNRYQPIRGSSYLSPLPMRENPKPAYPVALLDRELPPMTVIVRLIVGGTGKVENAHILDSASVEPAFAEAVLTAVRGWTFYPLQRVTGRVVEPLPFTQDYRFTFHQENGRAVVEAR